ncbi:MAG TPA: MurR/RpiR family transcriptional regulator [Firmicutes bacterium]|nr:MurR/RpiR family transcriptional regulator [Candidatus Fermentithermobacillaceae bacterium]
MSGLHGIYEKYSRLTPKQRAIADFVLAHPEEVCYLPLKQLSEKAGASEVSVLRFCRACGFDNYVQLKEAFRHRNGEKLRSPVRPAFIQGESDKGGAGRTRLHRLQQICEAEISNLTSMMDALNADDLYACARLLMKANEVLVFAHDGSMIFADYLCYRLNYMRIKAVSVKLGDQTSVQATLARLSKNDVVVLLSFPPYYRPVHDVARYARYRDTPVITITDSVESPAVIDEGITFICPTATQFYYNSHVATASFINILASCIAVEMGSRYSEILAEQQSIGDFMSSYGAAWRAESRATGDKTWQDESIER